MLLFLTSFYKKPECPSLNDWLNILQYIQTPKSYGTVKGRMKPSLWFLEYMFMWKRCRDVCILGPSVSKKGCWPLNNMALSCLSTYMWIFFSVSMNYSTVWPVVGWISRRWTEGRKGPYTSHCWAIVPPNPHIIQGSIYFLKNFF